MIQLAKRVVARARREVRRLDLYLWRTELELELREFDQRWRGRRNDVDEVVITYSGPEIHA